MYYEITEDSNNFISDYWLSTLDYRALSLLITHNDHRSLIDFSAD